VSDFLALNAALGGHYDETVSLLKIPGSSQFDGTNFQSAIDAVLDGACSSGNLQLIKFALENWAEIHQVFLFNSKTANNPEILTLIENYHPNLVRDGLMGISLGATAEPNVASLQWLLKKKRGALGPRIVDKVVVKPYASVDVDGYEFSLGAKNRFECIEFLYEIGELNLETLATNLWTFAWMDKSQLEWVFERLGNRFEVPPPHPAPIRYQRDPLTSMVARLFDRMVNLSKNGHAGEAYRPAVDVFELVISKMPDVNEGSIQPLLQMEEGYEILLMLYERFKSEGRFLDLVIRHIGFYFDHIAKLAGFGFVQPNREKCERFNGVKLLRIVEFILEYLEPMKKKAGEAKVLWPAVIKPLRSIPLPKFQKQLHLLVRNYFNFG